MKLLKLLILIVAIAINIAGCKNSFDFDSVL